MDPEGVQTKPVKRSEPHWYLMIYEDGCVLCGAGSGMQRVRMPGNPPTDPADRYRYSGGRHACDGHFL